MKEKYLVGIEFRYEYYDRHRGENIDKSEYIQIGMFNNIDKAILEGNKMISIFDKYYNRNPNYPRIAQFNKGGAPWGRYLFLITDFEFYPEIKVEFYAKIRALNFGNMGDVENTLLAINKKIGINLKEKS